MKSNCVVLTFFSKSTRRPKKPSNKGVFMLFQLEATQELVKTLSNQLSDLCDQMTEQRKQKQRIGLLHNAPSALNLGTGGPLHAPPPQSEATGRM